jgi:hypothetical protein
MEETTETFDFAAVPPPSPVPAPAVVILEEEKVVVPEPVPAPAPAPVVVEKVVPPAVTRLILPGVPSPTKPFKLRFGLRNKM